MRLMVEYFSSPGDLIRFVNKQGLKREDIVAITKSKGVGAYQLWFYL